MKLYVSDIVKESIQRRILFFLCLCVEGYSLLSQIFFDEVSKRDSYSRRSVQLRGLCR